MADTKQDRIRKAKALWDAKQDRKMALVREQQKRTANRTPEQIEAQKVRKSAKREAKAILKRKN